MCNTGTDDLNRLDNGIAFWAFDKYTGKRMDWTGYCICTELVPWAVYAVDLVGCEREFLFRRFRFEVL